MSQLVADRPRVSDLRGSAAAEPVAAVLEDPTGRRRRRLRFAGRMVAAALTLWLVGLVLGSVGLSPVPGIPFTHVLRPASPPPAVKHLRTPVQPSAADLKAAAPAVAQATPTTHRSAAAGQRAITGSRSTAGAHVVAGGGTRSHRHNKKAIHATPAPTITTPGAATKPPTPSHPNNGRHTGATTGGPRGTLITPRRRPTTPTTTTRTAPPGHAQSAPGRTGTPPPGQSRTRTSATP